MDEHRRLATGSGADPEIIKRVLNTEQLAMFDASEFDRVMNGALLVALRRGETCRVEISYEVEVGAGLVDAVAEFYFGRPVADTDDVVGMMRRWFMRNAGGYLADS